MKKIAPWSNNVVWPVEGIYCKFLLCGIQSSAPVEDYFSLFSIPSI